MTMNMEDYPHRRYNPLTGEWIIVSPHRTKRPWQGQEESGVPEKSLQYDPNCYLCPGNPRAGGERNPDYRETFVFTNDFPALFPDNPREVLNNSELFRAESEKGLCRVICFSPRHDLTLPLMDLPSIEKVVRIWTEQYIEIGEMDFINHVQIFENRGRAMGCSNPHPHGQMWANETVPLIPNKEMEHQKKYLDRHGSCLLCDYLAEELTTGERMIVENDSFAVLVPFWAVWPFEVMVLPKRHVSCLSDLTEREKKDLASTIKRFGIRLDNLFSTHTPYSMGFHQKPTDGMPHPEWHMHMHYLPPLLRSASVKKFMVGYELLSNPQRDITAEASAARLRDVSETHFTESQ